FPDATMKLDVWHFIMRQVLSILNPSKNPHRKEVVAEISCILKTHAEGGNPAKYWDRNEQETKLASTFKKWACKGTVWSAGARKVHEEQLKHVCKGCLECQRQDIRMDGSRVEGSHKGWNSLQWVHTSRIVTITGLCHDFVLRRNVCVVFSKAQKSDFVSSTHGSHHIHLIDKIAKLFNNFRLEEKATSTTYLPELKDIPSGKHFGLVTSSFASTYSGLLDIKTEDSDMTGPKFLEALSGDSDAVDLALLPGTLPATLDHFLKPRSQLPYCKAPSHCQLLEATPDSTPPVTAAALDGPVTTTITPTTLAPILRPPGMSRSQHFFMIVMRIDAHTMEILSSVEFHLFMDMRAEFAWISFKMMPKQWAAATETYNNHLEEKNHTNGSTTVKKNPQALLRKLGEIEVTVMNCVAKNDFKCEFPVTH
ncbi:hypothetical protein BDR06DRAFT_890751, partial [Suillus hirtellus]